MCSSRTSSLYILLFFIVFIPSAKGFFFDFFDDSDNSTDTIDLLSFFRPLLNLFLLGGPPNCGPPRTCPNYQCRNNPAVVHGYCCGCASPFDSISVPCPGNLQCPIYREPLCTDYRYMIDCCCNRN